MSFLNTCKLSKSFAKVVKILLIMVYLALKYDYLGLKLVILNILSPYFNNYSWILNLKKWMLLKKLGHGDTQVGIGIGQCMYLTAGAIEEIGIIL